MNNSYNRQISHAYIITVKGNNKSETLSERAQETCEMVNQPFKVWDAVEYKDKAIHFPSHISEDNIVRFLKMTNRYLTGGELACALSHISLWFECLKIDQPIIILEHDAVMIKKLEFHPFFNSVFYLGCQEYTKSMPSVPIPLYASDGKNNLFICRAHAYAIDPHVAKNMLSYVLQHGIVDPLDFLIRADLFSIQYDGTVYAYDMPENTTILNRDQRSENGYRLAIPNDNLEI